VDVHDFCIQNGVGNSPYCRTDFTVIFIRLDRILQCTKSKTNQTNWNTIVIAQVLTDANFHIHITSPNAGPVKNVDAVLTAEMGLADAVACNGAIAKAPWKGPEHYLIDPSPAL
jgi:hypothetical protein